MAKNNYPQGGIDDINPASVQQMVSSLKELHDLGRPKTDEETKQGTVKANKNTCVSGDYGIFGRQ